MLNYCIRKFNQEDINNLLRTRNRVHKINSAVIVICSLSWNNRQFLTMKRQIL
jgi:hypothetical protein